MSWKGFFYFTRSERQGIILLIVLIVLVGSSLYFIPPRKASVVRDDAFEKEYLSFKESLQKSKQQQAKRSKPQSQREVMLRTFDPNTVDSIAMLDLGLPPWVARNVLRYRAKGGIFRQASDFEKIYGLTAQQYTTLLPYLSIEQIVEQRPSQLDQAARAHLKLKKDSLLVYKYPAGTQVSLNQADTTELKKIPGIGSHMARKIVAYRKRLGGYHKVDQLVEIELNADSLRPWFSIGANEIQPINLNKASIELLRRHPYFNFYQAKVIVEYRKKKGDLHSLQQLKFYDEFTPTDMSRIAPYICFQ